MPLLVLGALSILGVGGLAVTSVLDSTDKTVDTANKAAPNVAVIGAIAVAGFAVWALARKAK